MANRDHERTATGMLADLECYWRALRGARRLPIRTEVDPARIDGALPHAFILEQVAPGVARMRVAGQAVADHLGMDPRGMPLSALFRHEARAALCGHVMRLFDAPALIALPLCAPRLLGRPRLAGRMLLLPLTDAEGKVTRALGAVELSGRAGCGQRRFDIDPDIAPHIEELRARDDPPHPRLRLAATAGGPMRKGPDMRPAPAPLRLVVSNG